MRRKRLNWNELMQIKTIHTRISLDRAHVLMRF